jgi:hypothetical protein
MWSVASDGLVSCCIRLPGLLAMSKSRYLLTGWFRSGERDRYPYTGHLDRPPGVEAPSRGHDISKSRFRNGPYSRQKHCVRRRSMHAFHQAGYSATEAAGALALDRQQLTPTFSIVSGCYLADKSDKPIL